MSSVRRTVANVRKFSQGQSASLPFVLAILDGWGVTKPGQVDDPTAKARTPFLHELHHNYSSALLGAHGTFVGLPHEQDGNSEAGHLNLGAGRIVEQESVVISRSIKDGTFFKNTALLSAAAHLKRHHSQWHMMGLLSNYNSGHSSPDHFFALLKFAQQQKISQVYIHFFTDGRDSPKYDALKFITEARKRFRNGEIIASVTGRFYAMDRKKEWSRTGRTYDLLTQGKGMTDTSPEEAVRHAYNRGESDEFVSPTVITDKKHHPLGIIQPDDVVVYWNLRSDRARQLAKPFAQKRFEELNPGAFKRQKLLKDLCFVALTDFGPDLGSILTSFPSRDLVDTLPMVLKDLRQLYVAESEKFAHITYFFNGGYDHPVGGEDRLVVPSPNVASYDLRPAMSALAITRVVNQALAKRRYDFIGVNFANPDMIGHTGNLRACIKAMEVVDGCLAQIGGLVHKLGGAMLVTADHGNVEETLNPATGEIDTEHSKNPVPCLLYHPAWRGKSFVRRSGVLGDVAPTILSLLGLPKPRAMTRQGLL
ncbi:MAG: 2,3-bisphosphoglycerate-independent phosphoglycerate mutase [Candidatus Kerfeldbacteria bacterium]|nr:2,3-bisphosphoglycerate-independent phosphoglycerate mutase [Candidatus Kerfeldbacteria bacterium]